MTDLIGFLPIEPPHAAAFLQISIRSLKDVAVIIHRRYELITNVATALRMAGLSGKL
jgi:hypothetical protein